MKRRVKLLTQADFSGLALITGAGLVSSVVYLAAMRSAANGAMAAPLDDSYIYFQYARAIAEGHPFAYTEGADPTMGATGFLYPFLLAPAFFIGLGGDGIVAYAFALNVLFLLLTAPLVYLLTRRYTGRFLATFAGLVTVIAGPVLWGFLSMMEVGLLALAVTSVVYFFSIERGSFPPVRTLVAAAALPFCRPEGALMAVFIAGIVVTDHAYVNYFRYRWPRPRVSMRRAGAISGAAADAADAATRPRPVDLLVFLPVAAAGAFLLSLWLVVGSFTTSTLLSKGIPYSPQLPWYDKLGFILNNAAVLVQDPFGLRPTYLPVVVLPIIGLGLAWHIGHEVRGRYAGIGILGLGLFFISVLSNSQSIGALEHHYRYIIPLFPLAMVFLTIGIHQLGRALPDGRHLAVGAVVVLAPLMLINTGQWAQVYAENIRDIHHQHVHMGRWIDKSLPEDAVVGVNDAGAMAYYGDRHVYDLVGLVSDDTALPFRHHTGAVFERMLSLPTDEQPDYIAIYPHWFDFPSGRFLNEVYRTRLRLTTISGGPEVVVYRLDYTAAEGAAEPEFDHTEGGAWELVDSLNSADLEDEARHNYRQIDLLPRGDVGVTVLSEHFRILDRDRHLIEGGRVILGAEEFDVATSHGRDLKIVMRANPLLPVKLRVYADGDFVGDWEVPAGSGAWMEPTFVVPGEFVGEGKTRLRLELDIQSADQDYAPYRYWLYQRVP